MLARDAARGQGASARQMNAAMRPHRPSRRWEKNAARSANVHHSPPHTAPRLRRQALARERLRSHCQRPRMLGAKAAGRARHGATNASRTSVADLEVRAPDSRSDPGQKLRRRARRRAHRGSEHPGGEPAPAGMGRADHRAVARGEQHRQAVGDLNHARCRRCR